MKSLNKFNLYLSLLFVAALAPAILHGQFYPAKTYSIVDGLPSNAIYDVTQADNGVMWFITSKGVTTYDAQDWGVFPDSLHLPTYLNSKLTKSEDGIIWAAGKNDTEFIIKYFDSGTWYSIPFPKDWVTNQVAFTFEVVKEKEHHRIVLAGVSNVYSYSTKGQKWKQLDFPEQHSPEINSTSTIDGRVFINTRSGQFAVFEDEIRRSKYDSLLEGYNDILTTSKKDSTLYILGFNWLGTIKNEEFSILSEQIGINSRAIYNRHSLVIDRAGRIFYSSASKVMQYDEQTGKGIPLEVNGRSNNIFSNKLYLDKENNIWSVDNRGLFKFNLLNFRSYNRDTGLAQNEVTAILESRDGTLYIANPSYLNVHKNGEIVQQFYLGLDDESPDRILQLTEHDDKSIYIAAGHLGLFQLKDGKLNSVFTPGEFPQITSVLSWNGEVYFTDGNYVYRKEGAGFNRLNNDQSNYIRNLVALSDENIAALSSTRGILLITDDSINNYKSEFLNYNNVYDAVRWQGELILGTSGGLATVKQGEIVPYKLKGFDDVVFSLLVDNKDQLWIGTFNGVYKWDGEVLEHFSVAHGLIGNEINRNALMQDRKGDVWIGTELGVSVYSENQVADSDQKAPDLYFTSISTSESANIQDKSSPELPANLKNLTFNFRGISFLHNDRIFYRYRLSGLEEDWNFTNNFSNPGVTYRNLDSGKYTFEIQARNETSSWSNSLTYGFSVAKPFYATWWFLLIILMLVATLFYVVFRIRYLYLIKKQKVLKSLVEERTKSIRDKNTQIEQKNEKLTEVNTKLKKQTDSLNTALSKLENAQVRLVQKEKMAALGVLTAGVAHEINNPVNYIKSASEIINEMIEEEESKLVIKEKDVFKEVFGSIEIGVERIVSIVKSLGSFSRTNETDNEVFNIHKVIDECLLILKNEYKGKVRIEKDFFDTEIYIKGNEGKVYQLFTNLILNAVQAIEGEGTILIRTWKKEQIIYIQVKDNGKGMEDDIKEKIFDPFFTTKDPGKGTGLGLSIAYNIVEEHQGSIQFDSTPGSGTTFTVEFPAEAN